MVRYDCGCVVIVLFIVDGFGVWCCLYLCRCGCV